MTGYVWSHFGLHAHWQASALEFRSETLRNEADFYQIGSLLDLLQVFHQNSSCHNTIAFSERCGVNSIIISSTPFSPTYMVEKVKIVMSFRMMIGVAYKTIIHKELSWSDEGYFLDCENGAVQEIRERGFLHPKSRSINASSVVTVTLDADFNVSFGMDDEDWALYLTMLSRITALACDILRL